VRTAVGLAVLLCALSSGCVYQQSIQQGNFLEKRAVDQLQVGMTRSQVRYLLGTPMVPYIFDSDRWDYLYYLKKSRYSKIRHELLTVYFENDKVSRFDTHGPVTNSEPVTTEAPPRPST
jgi:outer membrane protein assembly factor BamE